MQIKTKNKRGAKTDKQTNKQTNKLTKMNNPVVSIEFSPLRTVELTSNWYQ